MAYTLITLNFNGSGIVSQFPGGMNYRHQATRKLGLRDRFPLQSAHEYVGDGIDIGTCRTKQPAIDTSDTSTRASAPSTRFNILQQYRFNGPSRVVGPRN